MQPPGQIVYSVVVALDPECNYQFGRENKPSGYRSAIYLKNVPPVTMWRKAGTYILPPSLKYQLRGEGVLELFYNMPLYERFFSYKFNTFYRI